MLAKDSIEKKEFEKKEGLYNPDKWCPENRWKDYCDEKTRVEEQEAAKKKDSMFKDYNEMIAEENKNVSESFS